MTLFNLVFFKVLTCLLSVIIGFGAGKVSKVDRDSIAKLLFYFIAPIVFFAIPTSASLTLKDLTIPIIVFSMCAILMLFSYWLYGYIWNDEHRNILALSAGTGNGGYVVLPIAAAIFDDKTLTIFTLGLMGIAVCEASIGIYFCLQSSSTKRDSIIRVIKLPTLNAFFLGCIFSIIGFKMPDFLDDFIANMKGTFSVLGMVTIGLALSRIEKFSLDIKFTAALLGSKFVFFPILFYIFIAIDKFIFNQFDDSYYNAIILCALSPMATNTIIISSLYNIHPDKMATAVLISLLFVLIYLPLTATLLISNTIL